MIAKAFCPAHITGFFEICDSENLEQKGSKGAGICLSKGVVSTVEVERSQILEIEIFLKNIKSKGPVTRACVKKLIGDLKLKIKVYSELQLPGSQGFGMSGAGALSTGLALVKALKLNISPSDIIKTAHLSEIENQTGLGDIVAQAIGGFEIRRKPGIPPFGIVDKISVNHEIVLCVVGEKIDTNEVLKDSNYRKVISNYGSICLKKLLEKPNIENFFDISYEFSKRMKFISKEVFTAIDLCKKYGMASVSMIGNSVFAYGETENLVEVLKDFGKVYVCEIDNFGARILE